MQVFRAVQAQSNGKALLFKKTAPLFIDQCPVGLYAVLDQDPPGLMLFLECRSFFEEINAGKRGFPAVPGKAHHSPWMGADVLDDIGFKDVIGHPVDRIRPGRAGRIITIPAGHVAGIPHRFGKHLEIGFDLMGDPWIHVLKLFSSH